MSRLKLPPWRRTLNFNTTKHVGEFCAHVTASVFQGRVGIEWHDEGDVILEKLNSEIEVKGASNKDNFQIDVEQALKHRAKTPFPLHSYLYALCGHRTNTRRVAVVVNGKRKMRQRSPLAGKSKIEQFLQLETAFREMYLLDVDVITAFYSLLGAREGRFAGDGGKRVKTSLNRTAHLRPLWNGERHRMLASLGLQSSEWTLGRFELERPVTVDKHRYTVKFDLYTILKSQTHRRVVRVCVLPSNTYRYKGAK